MKTYYKNKILINGLFPMEKYKIDNYIEKTGIYDEQIINCNSEDYVFYVSGYLVQSMYSPEDKNYNCYEYFENEDYIELEVDDNIYNDNEKLQKYYLETIVKNVSSLEKKMRLMTGLAVGLPVFRTIIYDENKNYKTRIGYFNNQSSCLKIHDYNDRSKKILQQRLNFNISDESLKELEIKNSRFGRAYTFYNQSFKPDNINIRFILLFSALESLFNIGSRRIKNDISKYGSKIQFLDSEQEKELKNKLIDYYRMRSFYIHGNMPKKITDEHEFELREIVRKTLLIYWNISINISETDPILINKYIEENDLSNVLLPIKLFIKALDIVDFSEFYKETREFLLDEKNKGKTENLLITIE